jgi:hypothetical protein
MPMEKLSKVSDVVFLFAIRLTYLSYSLMYFATNASRWKICLLPILHRCS